MQAFCDERGEALTSEEAGERLSRELELDKEMRMYHRPQRDPQVPFPANAQVIRSECSAFLLERGR